MLWCVDFSKKIIGNLLQYLSVFDVITKQIFYKYGHILNYLNS